MSTIQSFCIFGKESQFETLHKLTQEETCSVIRGQYGVSSTIPVKDLVVGDIVILQQGDIVPADCMLIWEMDMTVNER
jgi:sodium/potassium-transporting ATPase subunit alpha